MSSRLHDPTQRSAVPFCHGLLNAVRFGVMPSVLIDYEPHVEQSERHCGHDQEVHGRNRFSGVAKESHPALLLAPVGWPLRHVARDGCEVQRESELQEFRVNLSGAPRIVQCEAIDQCSNLRR